LDASWSKRNLDYAQALFLPSTASGIPSAPDASKNWGAPYTGAVDETTRVGAKLESRLNDIFTLRADFRYSDIKREYFLIRQEWQNKALSYRWRYTLNQPFDTEVFQYGLYTDAVFTTGPLKHKVTLGGSWDDYDAGDNGSRVSSYTTTYSANLYGDPVYPAYSLPAKATSTAQRTTYNTVLLADRINFGEQWSLLIGGNWSRVKDSVTSTTAANVKSTSPYDDNAFTPTAALSFKPIQAVTTYVSYGEGLQQGFVAPSGSANAGQSFAPYVSRQIELGVKTALEPINVNVALFRIEQANQFTTGSGSSMVYSQDGQAVNQGVEVNMTGKVSNDVTIVGGFTFLNAKVEKAAANQGKTPQGVAEAMGRLYVEYALPFIPGLTVTGGMSYTGSSWMDAANTLSVPAVVVADAGLRYERKICGRKTTTRLNIANLTGEDYWTTRNNAVYLGSPQTVTASVTVALF
jgi:iron complex outermembrane recepter protein